LENRWRGIFFGMRYTTTRWKLTTKLQMHSSLASIPEGEGTALNIDENNTGKLNYTFRGRCEGQTQKGLEA
jgi:hypothetical protein